MLVNNFLLLFIISIVSAYGIRLIPLRYYESSKLLSEKHFEKVIYKKIRINKWKDYLPEWGIFLGFRKNKLVKKLTPKYIKRFINESYYTEVGHYLFGVLGFFIVVINSDGYLHITVTISIINFLCQIPFALIQRYNRPRLQRIYKRMTK